MIIFLNIWIYLFIFFVSLIVFISRRKYILLTLIRLEFIVLILFGFIFLNFIVINYEHYFCIVFLTFRVCEGSLGLAILVSLIRLHGNDYFQTYNILQC